MPDVVRVVQEKCTAVVGDLFIYVAVARDGKAELHINAHPMTGVEVMQGKWEEIPDLYTDTRSLADLVRDPS